MLTHCPICKYDLTGLPDRHLCPECGYDYDRNSEPIELEPLPRWLQWVIAFLIPFGSFDIVYAWATNRPNLWYILSFQPLAILAAAVSIRPGRPVALVRSGDVQIIKRRKLYIQYPLDNVTLANWEYVNGGVRLLNAEQHELHRIHKPMLWSGSAMKKLAAAINKRLELQSTKLLNDSVAVDRTSNQVNNVSPC